MSIKNIFKFLFGKDYEEEKYEEGLRCERVQIRVTKQEKMIIEKLAKLQYLDTSNFIRWLVFNKYMNDFIK